MIFCENFTEFYQISLKILVNLTDFSPQICTSEFSLEIRSSKSVKLTIKHWALKRTYAQIGLNKVK